MWHCPSCVTNGLTAICNRLTKIRISRLSVDEGVAVCNLTTMASVSLNEDIEEVADSWLINGIMTNNDDSPGLKRLKVGGQELLTTEIPATLGARVDLGACVENLGVLKKASIGLLFC